MAEPHTVFVKRADGDAWTALSQPAARISRAQPWTTARAALLPRPVVEVMRD